MPKKKPLSNGARLPGFGGWGDEPAMPPAGARAPDPKPAPVERANATPAGASTAHARFVERVVESGSISFAPVESGSISFAPVDVLVEPAALAPDPFAGLDEVLDVAVREVLAFPVAHFPHLPLPTTLHAITRAGARFVVTTSRASYAAARERGEPVFVGGELLALAHAAQNDRMFAVHFDDAIERKRRSPEWRCTPAFAIGQIGDATALEWNFERVLARVGARLLRVEVHA